MKPLAPQHQKALQAIVGEENFHCDPAHLQAYSFDSTRLEKLPQAVLFPRHQEDIQAILNYANAHAIPITPRGAGSGMSGGSINEGVILGMQKHFHRILHIDPENLCVTTEVGVINAHLNEALKPYGLFFAPDPASSGFSTLGGNIAQNAGGMSALKYGTSKDNLLCLKAVLGNGQAIQVGHNTRKDVAGYDLLGLLSGSAGTLAILTELTLKLHPIPPISRSMLLCFPSIQSLCQSAFAILSSGVSPSAMEFLDQLTTQALNHRYGIYPKDSQALLILRLDASSEAALAHDAQRVSDLAPQALLIRQAQNAQEEQEIWFGRKNASQANSIYGIKKLNEDITIPRSQVATFLHYTEELGQRLGFSIPCFGHIGDGNIHTNVMIQDLKDLPKAREAIKELFGFALSLGGTLSGEHGVGITKAEFMPLAFSPAQLELFAQIKKIFDPQGILNPHKMGL